MERSMQELIKQKTSREGYLQDDVVNTRRTGEALNSDSAQTMSPIHEHHNHLMEQVVRRENMRKALRRVERNRGAPGVDGMKVEPLRRYLIENWTSIKKELLNGTYKPQAVRRVEISKPSGGVRLLGIPTVLDRLIQQAILQVLTPIFDSTFSGHSYGFRPNRNAHQAVKRARRYIKEGYNYVVDIDLEKFFDRVNHDILMSRVARKVMNKRMLKLIRCYLQAGVMINGCCIISEEGTPQGGPLSPLLANIVLHEWDEELSKRNHRFVRYADDCNIYVKSKRAGKRVLQSVGNFVESKLKLRMNREKSAVGRPTRRKILGFSFFGKETRIRIASPTIERFKEKIRKLTNRNVSQPMSKRIEKLNTYLIGWITYFRLADTRSVPESLDEWIRRRLRACLLKQWKKPKTRKRNLVALGIPQKWAMLISGSRKKYWRLAITHQMHKALGLAYWQDQGLLSLTKRYDELRLTL